MKVTFKTIFVFGLLIPLILSACAGTRQGSWVDEHDKTLIGGLGGAAAGGLLAAAVGGDTAGILAGTLIGGLVGAAIGDRLDAADRKEAQHTTQHALETSSSGTATAWHNPDSGNSGSVMPLRTFQKANGQYCREYMQTLYIGGEEHQAYGTACRQADGTWRIVSS